MTYKQIIQLDLIGVGFDIELERDEDASYFDAFMGAYETPLPQRNGLSYRVSVRRHNLPSSSAGEAVRIHDTVQPYWRLQGQPAAQGWLLWTGRKAATRFGQAERSVEIIVDPDQSATASGEIVFHVCRSLALYSRDPSSNFVHASGVVGAGGAILFTGGVCAGKTTLMTEAVINGGARPLTNDRVLISGRGQPLATSWPAYASFTEGTLLTYPALTRAAQSYEADDCAYRTQRWNRPLRPDFSKRRKRIFPMRWFSDAVGTSYVATVPIRALVVCRVDATLSESKLTKVDLEREGTWLEGMLRRQSFDRVEPSWRSWHGLPLPRTAPSVSKLIARLRSSDASVYRLKATPEDYKPLYGLLHQP